MAEATSKAIPTRKIKKVRVPKRTKMNWKTTSKYVKSLTKNIWMFVVVIILLVGAQAALYKSPLVGIYTDAAAFATLIGIAIWSEKVRQLAISAAILPIAALLTLSLPQKNVFAQTLVFYSAILLLALVYRFMFTLDFPTKFTKLGVHGYARLLPFMIVAGEALGIIGYGMLRHHYEFSGISLSLVAVASVIMAITEETYFRGLIQQRGSLVFHPAMAAALSAVLYAATTISLTTMLAPLFALISGIVLSVTYYKYQNLFLTTTINALMKLTYLGLLATYVLH
jgi:membrane protease YdiL (CAAX protease family)